VYILHTEQYKAQRFLTIKLTSFWAMGAQINTLGNANIHATIHADIHTEKRLSMKPTVFNVVIPAIRNDIMQDKMSGNKRFTVFT
jgi:hypothetical protein